MTDLSGLFFLTDVFSHGMHGTHGRRLALLGVAIRDFFRQNDIRTGFSFAYTSLHLRCISVE